MSHAATRVLRWRPLDGEGLEHLHLALSPDRIIARGVLIGAAGDLPFGLGYDIVLDLGWRFRRLDLRRTDGATLVLECFPDGRWLEGGTERPDLSGCIDIDLSASPFTNTLPIRRARFTTGVPQRFDIAYVDATAMRVRRDGQIYTRLGDQRFRYQAADGGFEAEIAVDADGLVRAYPPLFVMV